MPILLECGLRGFVTVGPHPGTAEYWMERRRGLPGMAVASLRRTRAAIEWWREMD